MAFWLAFIVAVIGIVMYTLAANDKAKEIGRIAYKCGLFVVLLAFLLRDGPLKLFNP